MEKGQTSGAKKPKEGGAVGAKVVEHVRRLIEDGSLRPGDRLPAERDLALQIQVSRPSLRSGLRTLQAMGVIEARQGSGTYIADGPPKLGDGPLRFLAALHGFTRDEMFEARRVLEVGTTGLAAERATPEHIARIADEVTSMFATLDDPQTFLVHDLQFHRAVAAGSGNAVLATLIDTVAELVFEYRRTTVERARDLRESAELHRRIYKAIRDRNPDEARRQMSDHLNMARMAQAAEEDPAAGPKETALAPRPRRKK
ncbi:MAG: FadR family transcriptional regulator [Acidobacteria bacterium]|nr:FadR family transcriptional regulator [Acidobacteriota bacterium]MCG3191454.1 Transcriptional regulator NanR [Thermoanaerobaculia bacterium]MCK6681532.1 FadR family transcriptional regulator [Thermoanaerobaculia bacterium]